MSLVMATFGIVAYVLLLAYAMCVGRAKRMPTMLSEIYYITKSSCSSWLMGAMAIALLPYMLDMGGLQCMAFLTAGGLLFVAVAPAYLSEVERGVHKAGALVAAGASVVWTLYLPTYYSLFITLGVLLVFGLLVSTHRKYGILLAEIAALTNVVIQIFISFFNQ